MVPRILIADDERLAAMALRMFLSDEGYDVRTATSAERTIREGRAFRPDVLLVDYLLGPGQRGTDVARALQVDMPALKVVVMTGLPADRTESNRDLDGFLVLAKPLDLAQVARSVADAVGERS